VKAEALPPGTSPGQTLSPPALDTSGAMPARQRRWVLPCQSVAGGAFRKTERNGSVSTEELSLLQDERSLAPGRLTHTSSR